MAKRQRRKAAAPYQQLAFDLAAVTAPPPLVPVDSFVLGYFKGIRMSNGQWWLTVDAPKFSYVEEERTPQRWWWECCRDEYTLHGWCPDMRHVVSSRDDVESASLFFEVKATAVRWLRSFNEAFQVWRMETWHG